MYSVVETIHPQNGVGHREATRGEDNVVVLKDVNVIFTAFHIFGCCCFSVATHGEDNVDVF